jgi:hypothetical protein
MSLAPGERRALATIEDSLSRSDPQLARMLTRFTMPASRAGVAVVARRLRQLRPRIISAVIVIVAFLLVLAVLRSPATPLRRAARTGTAATQVSNCPPPWPAGYPGSTAGDSTAESAADQGAS